MSESESKESNIVDFDKAKREFEDKKRLKIFENESEPAAFQPMKKAETDEVPNDEPDPAS